MSLPGELLRIKAAATNTCSSHGEATVRLSFHVGHCQLHLWGCWELLPHRTARSSISSLELTPPVLSGTELWICTPPVVAPQQGLGKGLCVQGSGRERTSGVPVPTLGQQQLPAKHH